MKIVEKKWGKEEWLSLDDNYCFKKITIFAGHKTSLQYHNNKTETTHILSGKAEYSYFEGGKIKTIEVGPGFTVYLLPGTIHRFSAIEDTVMFEASTPEVDDVVRLQDDYGREGTCEP